MGSVKHEMKYVFLDHFLPLSIHGALQRGLEG